MRFFELSADINYIAVIVASLAAFIVGFLWHGPVFGKLWLKLAKVSEADIKAAQQKSMAPRMLAALVQQLVVAGILAHLFVGWGATTLAETMEIAFWIWLGFIAMVLLNGFLWEKKSFGLYLFEAVYHLVSIWVVTVILTVWR